MIETITVDFEQPIPLFPLDTCLLLPHSVAPLHVFEDRYKKLAERILDTNGLVVMAMYAGQDALLESRDGRPALRPFGCLGYVEQYERLPDGRYLLLLQGVCRVRLGEEVASDPYRMVRVSPHGMEKCDEQILEQYRTFLNDLLASGKLPQLEHVQSVYHLMESKIPTPALVDLLSTFVFDDTESMYGMLEEEDISARAEMLIDRIQFLVDIAPPDGDAPSMDEGD